MSATRILQQKNLGPLFQSLTAAKHRILAPIKDGERISFAEVTAPDKVALDYVQTDAPAKAAVFPPYEIMLRYRLKGKDAEVEEVVPPAQPTVLFGLHPCDAASFATLQAVFTWDSPDVYFESKLAATTVIGLNCTKGDAYCFCTSVGGGPGETRGSDILLTLLAGGRYLAEILTPKGEAIVKLAPTLFEPAGAERVAWASGPRPVDRTGQRPMPPALAKIAPRFGAKPLAEKLPKLFDKTNVWVEQSLRCIGCGACAFVCPTCTCFDIQDERERYGGVRLRCWDSCGFSLFTLHASGHNPRTKQSERWRQRIMHKFSFQPERLGVLGCVGCGRCSRSCPADMNLAEHAAALAEI